MKLPSRAGIERRVATQCSRLPGVRARLGARLQQPVFILGCARSGTTLLNELLTTHPDVVGWSEANEIWDPSWYPWRADGSPRLPVELDPEAFTVQWWSENAARAAEIRGTFGAYQWLERRACFVNKSPFLTFRLPQLVELFPGARFVNIVRDGRATVASYVSHLERGGKLREWPPDLRARFERDPVELAEVLARYWQRTVLEVEAQATALGLDEHRLLTLRYEDLCRDPASHMATVQSFLGLRPWPLPPTGDVRPPHERWREQWNDETLRRITANLEPTLSRLGYTD